MARPIARFRYGATLDNYVDADFPLSLDAVSCWRQLAPGSDRERNAAGTTDGWTTGRDYMLQGNLRWADLARWSPGGLGVQGFMDWATGQNPFRFIPDKANENFYVDNCFLVDPFDEWNPSLESANDSQSVQFTFRNALIDFGQAIRGVVFEYLPGSSLTEPTAATITRGGSTATYHTRDGAVKTAPANVLRDAHYINGIRSTLMEVGWTNLILQSENFGTTWTTIGTPTRTASALQLGDLALDLIGDDDAAAFEGYRQTGIVFSGNGVKGVSFYARAGTTPAQLQVEIEDTTASAFRLIALVSWTNSVPTVSVSGGTVGTVIRQPEAMGAGVYRFFFQTLSVTAANAHRMQIYPAANGTAQVGNTYIGGVQVEDFGYPSSYVKTTTATASHLADSLTWVGGFQWPAQAMWVYLKFVTTGTDFLGNNPFLFNIGNSGTPQFNVIRPSSSSVYTVRHFNELGNSVTVNSASAGTFMDVTEVLAILNADGSVRIVTAFNGGGETASSTSAVLPMTNSWAFPDFSLGQNGAGNFVGMQAYQTVRVGVGSRVTTIAQARAA